MNRTFPNRVGKRPARYQDRVFSLRITVLIARWIFAQRLAGHSLARTTRALNDAAIPPRPPPTWP